MGDPVMSLVSPVLGRYSASQAVLRCFSGLRPDFPKPKVELCLTSKNWPNEASMYPRNFSASVIQCFPAKRAILSGGGREDHCQL